MGREPVRWILLRDGQRRRYGEGMDTFRAILTPWEVKGAKGADQWEAAWEGIATKGQPCF